MCPSGGNSDEEREERIARNESAFRRVNEAIEAGLEVREGEAGFVCECGRLGCATVIGLTVADYEAVRRHFERFVVMPGHEEPGVEHVVERREGYFVVAKDGLGKDIAAVEDPRT